MREFGTEPESGELTFAIGSISDDLLSTQHPTGLLKKLPLMTIKDNGYDLHRYAARIAKGSRRGMGNMVLYNSTALPKMVARQFHFVYCPELEPDEYVIMYRGISYFDGPFFMKERKGTTYYGTHPEWEKYCIRFKLEG